MASEHKEHKEGEEIKVEEKLKTPSRLTEGRYAVLQETSGEEHESWLYFIRIEGNEENLKHLYDQLEKVDWYIIDDLCTFDLEIERNVSALTAKEMTKLELNHCSFHRKFDGVLKKIDFNFRKKDDNETKICKCFDIIGFGLIEDYIDDEDIDEEDMISGSESESDSDSGSGMRRRRRGSSSSSSYVSDSDDSESKGEDKEDKEDNSKKLAEVIQEKKKGRMPAALKKLQDKKEKESK